MLIQTQIEHWLFGIHSRQSEKQLLCTAGHAATMSEFPVQSSQECQTCIAELDASNLNGQVRCNDCHKYHQPALLASSTVDVNQFQSINYI